MVKVLQRNINLLGLRLKIKNGVLKYSEEALLVEAIQSFGEISQELLFRDIFVHFLKGFEFRENKENETVS